MRPETAVEKLDQIDCGDDPERAHVEADDVLHAAAPSKVRAAYRRVAERTREWWFA